MHMHTNTNTDTQTQTPDLTGALTLTGLARFLGVHRNTAAKLRKTDETFPKAVEIMPGVERFLPNECVAYRASRPRVERRADPACTTEKYSALAQRGWQQRRARMITAGASATA
jgi:hypothetical protein